jgi:hypothetical protein
MWSSQYSRQFIGSCDFLDERLAGPVVPEPQESDQPEFELWRGVFDSAPKGRERKIDWGTVRAGIVPGGLFEELVPPGNL